MPYLFVVKQISVPTNLFSKLYFLSHGSSLISPPVLPCPCSYEKAIYLPYYITYAPDSPKFTLSPQVRWTPDLKTEGLFLNLLFEV
jgi:hypothetical protein